MRGIRKIGEGSNVKVYVVDDVPKAVKELKLRFEEGFYKDEDGNIVILVKRDFKIMPIHDIKD